MISFRRIKLWHLFVILIAVAIVSALIKTMYEGKGLQWLVEIPSLQSPPIVGDFATILAPLLAVSIAVERLLETVFDWFEKTSKSIYDVVSEFREGGDWIEKELQKAQEAAKLAAEKIGIEVDNKALEDLEAAEQRLAKAQERYLGWANTPAYVAFKRALCIWIGLMAGLIIAVFSDLGMFRLIGIPAPRILDMLLTGFVIGAGPGPMHSLIGILQGIKNSLDSLAETTKAKSKEVREAAIALKAETEKGG